MCPQRAQRAPRSPKGARNRGIQADLDADIPHYETEPPASQNLPFGGTLISVALDSGDAATILRAMRLAAITKEDEQ